MSAPLPIVPPALRPGDRLRVVAPSGPFERVLALRGIAFLATRYRVEFDWSIFSRHRTFAGPDDRRRDELAAALSDPGIRAVVAARGGYGITRILPRVRVEVLRESPRWIVGFSDITALHVEATRLGVASLHGPNLTGLGRSDALTRFEWVEALEHPTRRREITGLEGWHAGTAQGPLVGGNLTLLFTCAAAGRLVLPEGAILVLEDVTEFTYRIDRMLTALITSGLLDNVAGVIVGELTDCPTGRYGAPADQVVRECLAPLGVPILAGLPFGHGTRNLPIPLGRVAHLDGSRNAVVFNPLS